MRNRQNYWSNGKRKTRINSFDGLHYLTVAASQVVYVTVLGPRFHEAHLAAEVAAHDAVQIVVVVLLANGAHFERRLMRCKLA